ncbi:MAG: cysteine-rich repeat protein, partial [Bradymonadia bacterium]
CFPVVCGDGIIASTEGCEDGNTESDDGCSATCRVELPTGGEEALMEGGLSSEDGTWIRPNRSCDSGTSERFYDAYWVVNPSDSPVVINIEVAFSFDVYDHLFDATFNPDEPTVGCLLGNDDDGRFTTSALRRVTIPADEKRVTVVWTLLSHRFE